MLLLPAHTPLVGLPVVQKMFIGGLVYRVGDRPWSALAAQGCSRPKRLGYVRAKTSNHIFKNLDLMTCSI